MTTSGTTTAAKAAMGAYCKPRCAHFGNVHGRLEMKKNPRVTTVITPKATMVSKV
jgi:hypothetical protein